MIDGVKLNTVGISPYQRRLRLKELSGIPLTEEEKKRLQPRTTLLSETVSMVEIPKNRKQNVPPKIEVKPDEVDDYDDLDLDEILREMGYGDDEDVVKGSKSVVKGVKTDVNDYYHWGYEDGDDIDVSELSEDEIGELIYYILTGRENMDDEESVEEMFEGVLNVGTLQFSSSLSTNNKTLVFIPRSSKMLDTIENMKISKRDIVDKIINVLKKKYRGLNFRPSHSYEGYGYGVDVDMFSFV